MTFGRHERPTSRTFAAWFQSRLYWGDRSHGPFSEARACPEPARRTARHSLLALFHRHQPLQLFKPVLDDDDLCGLLGVGS